MCFMRVGAGQVKGTLCHCVQCPLRLRTPLIYPLTGTKYSGIPFRRALLDTIPRIGMFDTSKDLIFNTDVS